MVDCTQATSAADCGSDTVSWKTFLGYVGTASYDEQTILTEVALAASEVLSKWNILTQEFSDDLQCGVKDYKFNTDLLECKGMFIDDVLFVSAQGICFKEKDNRCGYECHTFDYDENTDTVTLSDAPNGDVRGGLRVRVRYNFDINTACCMPKKFVQKYGGHIKNYMLYKRAISQTDNSMTATQLQLLYRDAVEYFEENEWKPFIGMRVNATAEKRVRFC